MSKLLPSNTSTVAPIDILDFDFVDFKTCLDFLITTSVGAKIQEKS